MEDLKKLFSDTEKRWRNLDKCLAHIQAIKAVLQSDKHRLNPFSLWWHDNEAIRHVNFDPDLTKQWNDYKVQTALRFSALIEKQVKRDKAKLGFFSKNFKALDKANAPKVGQNET